MTNPSVPGDRFERLELIRVFKEHGDHGPTMGELRCVCGVVIVRLLAFVRYGGIRSCGCLLRELRGWNIRTHGKSGTPEHRAWKNMHTRCLNPIHPQSKNYRGRGISICDRWMHSFENFLADMGEKPSPKHSLDRIDNNGHYTPENCRWATNHQQSRNRTDTTAFTYKGETHCLTDWCLRYSLNVKMVQQRIKRGWSIDRSLETPRMIQAQG